MLDPADLIGVLELHHQRVIQTWRAFTPDQWAHPSRNADWTVHQTVRHVADTHELGAGAANGDTEGNEIVGFDPNSTPDAWLDDSAGESPAATIDRFAAATTRLRSGVSNRLAADDQTQSRTVYGTAHWTTNVVHILWDSWLHERDILLPLGLDAESTTGEQRLVGLYGLLMAVVPTMLFKQSIAATVELVGLDRHTISVTCGPDGITAEEDSGAEVNITGSHASAIDALAGRGRTVSDALPGVPEEFGAMAAFLSG